MYFFCYSNTLQEEALSLIASKIAATTRVNGDIINAQSLADLDELANTDMVSALTNVVTRSTETRSLKDAFREANEAFRAGQQVIGDFREEEKAIEIEVPAPNGTCLYFSLIIHQTRHKSPKSRSLLHRRNPLSFSSIYLTNNRETVQLRKIVPARKTTEKKEVNVKLNSSNFHLYKPASLNYGAFFFRS